VAMPAVNNAPAPPPAEDKQRVQIVDKRPLYQLSQRNCCVTEQLTTGRNWQPSVPVIQPNSPNLTNWYKPLENRL